ncbi:hypothetical protein C809_00604 [Lachnospiraceae bacterium MD335]|nr:hypothetical protein C809_00604 [Lachnospiraceae bacterium MD335]
MIVKALEIFTEYISIVLCIHRAAGKQIKINWYSLLDYIIYIILMFLVEKTVYGKLILFVYWFIYLKIRIADTWKHAVKSFVITMCLMPMLQILIYATISEGMQKFVDIYCIAISANILIIFLFLIWKEKYLSVIMNAVTKFRKIIFLVLLIFLFKCMFSYFSTFKMINAYFMDQLAICFLIMALMFILWINSENEKKHKAEELRTYQLYTKTFEDAVTTIRMKQHEFDNHINAIKCIGYTIHDTEKLIDEQDKYCDKILQDNKYNKVLKLNISPILVGFLYSKFTAASAHGINIEYEIQDIEIMNVSISDLVEIIGILFDNAVEALEEQGDKEMEVSLLRSDNTFTVSIANISSWKTNSEIEKFFEYGYSTKGKEHGIGLYRVNMLMKKYKACIQVENITKNDSNYLCFKAIF